MIFTLLSVLIIFLILGLPMMIPMIAAPIAVIITYMSNVDPVIIGQQLLAGIQPFVLLAVPMFIFAADIMCAGQTANRLLDFVEKFVGHIYGGMAITTAAACTLFGAISGSTQATVVAIGKPMRKKLMDGGYKDKDILSLIVNSSTIALLIPPSIGMIMYAVVTGTSVGKLFIAGIGPGFLVLFLFSIYNIFHAKKEGVSKLPRASLKDKVLSTKRAILPCGLPIIIVGGIYSGFFSPTEAAAASVLYALILETTIFKTIKWKEIPQIATSTGMITAAVFILVACGQLFSWVISYAKLPQRLIEAILNTSPSRIEILLLVTVFYFIGCMFFDQIVVIIILTPIFFPMAMATGIDPIHLGIVITLQAAIGAASPPFGCNIFTACAVFDRTYLEVVRGTVPYLMMLVIASMLIMFFPGISLFLTNFL